MLRPGGVKNRAGELTVRSFGEQPLAPLPSYASDHFVAQATIGMGLGTQRQNFLAVAVLLLPSRWLWLALLVALAAGPGKKATVAAEDRAYETAVKPFLAKHCLACHGDGAKAKRVRLDRLTPDFAGAQAEHWLAVLDKVRSGDMPPKPKPRPDAAEQN